MSANIYTTIVDVLTLGSEDPIDEVKLYVLLNSLMPMFVSLVCAPMLREIKWGERSGQEQDQYDGVGHALMLVITVATGVYSVFGSVRSGPSRF